MKKALLIASVLFIAVISTACINNIAVQELNNKAAEYMQKGDYESAINRLQASIDLDSTMYETYYNLGIAATNAKKYDMAIEAFEDGMKINPDYTGFYYSLAIAQSEKADEILENEDISFEDRKSAVKTKQEAMSNLKKYLNIEQNAEDADEIKELISEIETFINESAKFDINTTK
ncbi:tetratricopeptide repeat protein [bacterium]|nr:tetratricopeptide repeat protein [bacterium]